MADGYRYLQQSAGNHFYPQPYTANHHARQQIIRNSTPPNNLRSAFQTETPSPSRSPDSHSPAPASYGMYGQGHQGQHGRVNGGPGRQLQGMMYNFNHQPAHQQQHPQHHANLQQDHTTHATNGSVLGHHTNYSSGVLSNATPSFTPSSLQNGHTTTTRGGQAQVITEYWAEQMRLHKESENANQSMVEHGAPNHFARARAGENRGLTTNADAASTDENNEDRSRPYRQEMVKRQDWHSMDISGQGLKVLATPLFDYVFLSELYVASNKISRLPESIGQLRYLTHLDASFNQLTELPKELGMCVYLKKLLVFNNRIETVPFALGALHQLEQLGIEGNPHLDPDIKSAISEKGTKALIKELKESAPGRIPYF
jgi:CCR4-NOT transcription complex subunit 6